MQSAVSIYNAISARVMSPADAIARCLDAIAERDAGIGAFAALGEREALLKGADAGGPLAGIGFGIKDIFDTFDLPTAYGSPAYAGHRPAADAALVAMIRAAGATVVGKTVTTEFAYLQPAVTRNPHDPAHTPGGSSSGSAAAVAAGMVPAAIGTQTGGSVIRPAAFCGVAGYKPSFRLLPTVGSKTFSWSLDTAGLFAAGVADLAFLAARLTGRDLDIEGIEPKSLRVGLYRSSHWREASAEMRDAVEQAGRLAAEAGAGLRIIEEPAELAEGRAAHSTIQDFEAGLALGGDFMRHADAMSETLRRTLEAGRRIDPKDYDAARGKARRARRAATALFDEVDILIKPSAPGAAPRGLESTGSPIFNKLWTLTGNPCVNVPGMRNAAGLPLGVQVICRFGRDRLALSAAAWLEGLIARAG